VRAGDLVFGNIKLFLAARRRPAVGRKEPNGKNGKGHPLSVRERATNPLAPGKCGWPQLPPGNVDGPNFH